MRAPGLALALVLAACGAHAVHPHVEVLLDDRAAHAVGMGSLVGSVDVSPSRLVVLGDKDRLYVLGWGGATTIDGAGVDAFAYTHDGLLLAVRGTQLVAFGQNAFAPVYDLPNAGMSIAPGAGDAMYLYDRSAPDGHYGLYRLTPGRRAAKLLDSPAPIDAVADAGDRLFVAIGGVVFVARPGKPMTVAARLGGGAKIVSIAADGARLYLSDGSSVYALVGRHVERVGAIPGGLLRVHDHALFVLDPATRLLVRVSPM